MKVDITKKVLNKIQNDKVQIKPRWQFMLARVALISFVSVLAFYLFLVTGGLAFISKNQIFFDYLSLGAKGIMSFFVSLPWLALIMFMGIATLIVMMIKNFEFIYKHRYVPMALMLVFLVFGGVAFGMSGKGSDSIQAKIADAIRFNKAKPTQVSGKVYQVDEKALIIVNDKNNKISINISSSTYYKNGKPEAGDKILVIGKMTDDKIDADIVKIIKKAGKQAEQKGEVKSEKTENKAQEDQPKAEPTNNEQPKTNSSSPAPAPSPSPTPTPTPVPEPFAITSVEVTNDASYVYVKLNFNQPQDGKCQAYFKKGSTVKSSSYTYNSSPANSCTAKMLVSDLGGIGKTWSVEGCYKYPFNVWSENIVKNYGSYTIK